MVARRLYLGSGSKSLRRQRGENLRDNGDANGRETSPARPTDPEKVNERDSIVREIEVILDIFGDSYCNKHLLYGIVELCLVRLVPEISEMGVRELMESRLGEGWDNEDE